MQRITVKAEVNLEEQRIAELFDAEFEGWCPVCKDNTINLGEVICCECFKRALMFHINICGCYP